ncbi:MAG: hypothetical protein LBG27_02185 [Spirochaetaceae bacterium]|nr:hypothetical protein [Spirochaetaceae bacterium]
MRQNRPMTLHEKLQIGVKGNELRKQGKIEEAEELEKQIPLAPYLARFYKKHLGLEALLQSGWNLWEAVEEYGPEFLSK